MTLGTFETAARKFALSVFGVLDCTNDAAIPDGAKSLVLLGPGEPGFWAHVTREPEFRDGLPDPLDRWSTRVITALASDWGGQPIFPFGGPPFAPFQRWAVESGRAWPSPVGFLVHDVAGLWVSFRGAIALPDAIEIQPATAKPCDSCADKPCLTACPVGALTDAGYDLPKCHTYLDGPGANTCMTSGCAVRSSCPAGADYGRMPAQSAFHMRHFHK